MTPRIIKTKDYTGPDRRIGRERRQNYTTIRDDKGNPHYLSGEKTSFGKMLPCRRTSSVGGDRRWIERTKSKIRDLYFAYGIKDAANEYAKKTKELNSRVKAKEISPETAGIERAKLAAFVKELIKGNVP